MSCAYDALVEGMALHRIDTNLLVALATLLETGSVTDAAHRHGVTQSAMSQTLRRLRELLDDPLFVRVGARMEPTPRAAAMQPKLAVALGALGAALADDPDFSPAKAERTFNLAVTDYVAQVVLPVLLAELREQAPGVALEVRPLLFDTVPERLARGDLDLAIGATRPVIPDGFFFSPVLEEGFACLVRHGHPLLRRKRDLRAFARARHAVVAPRGQQGSLVDTILDNHGLQRRVVLRLPYFLAVPAAVAATDLVATVPRRIAHGFARKGELVAYEPPIEIDGFTLHQVWHPRFAADHGLRWLRGVIDELL